MYKFFCDFILVSEWMMKTIDFNICFSFIVWDCLKKWMTQWSYEDACNGEMYAKNSFIIDNLGKDLGYVVPGWISPLSGFRPSVNKNTYYWMIFSKQFNVKDR